ncbi:hypothetical protein V6C31_09435 [Caldibacillus debilis]|uniref:hypothetical protein n=1 Tax=Caldibacillus debilis TaxID=301148 RepID=UPI002FDB0FEA
MKKSLLFIMFLVGFFISSLGMTFVDAASNHKDTPFGFNFENSVVAYTEPRTKYNNTSAYMKATSILIGKYFNAQVTTADKNPVGPKTRIELNKPTYLINYAFEIYNRPVDVRIKGEKIHGTKVIGASGVWSPDSI